MAPLAAQAYDPAAISSMLTNAVAISPENNTVNFFVINAPPAGQDSPPPADPPAANGAGTSDRDFLHEALARMIAANTIILPNGDEYISNGDIQTDDGTLEFVDGKTGQTTVLTPTKLNADQTWVQYFHDMGYEGLKLAGSAVPAAVVAILLDKLVDYVWTEGDSTEKDKEVEECKRDGQ